MPFDITVCYWYFCMQEIPKQGSSNCVDCGVFLCQVIIIFVVDTYYFWGAVYAVCTLPSKENCNGL